MGGQAADVLVLGAGPAGLSAAIGLAGRGLRITSVTLGRNETDRIGESLSPAAAPLLRELGRLGHLRRRRPFPLLRQRLGLGERGAPSP